MKTREPYVRVNICLRKDDAAFLTQFAYREALRLWNTEAFTIRRGERPGASMAIRLLIDAERQRQTK